MKKSFLGPFPLNGVCLLFFLAGSSFSLTAQEVIPENYQWKNRLILLFAPDKANAVVRQQIAILTKKETEVTDRDLLYFLIVPGTPAADGLFRRYEADKKSFSLVLIGKDGGVKLRATELVPFERMAELIDGMPMRRAEMRRKNRTGNRR